MLVPTIPRNKGSDRVTNASYSETALPGSEEKETVSLGSQQPGFIFVFLS